MKKILLIALLAILSTSPAYAYRGHGGGWGRGGGWGGAWVVPALIGGAIGTIAYGLTAPFYASPAPVYAPGYASGYAPGYAPAYAPGYAPAYAQAYAPSYAPAYSAPAAPASAQSLYFCAAANDYYPRVRSCQGGWQAIPATPPDAIPGGQYGAPPPR